jgi:methylmalonyl-CoA decarboxylase
MPLINVEFADHIGTVVMNHVEKRNALSNALIEEVLGAIQHFNQTGARVIVLRAPPGSRVWSAGHDVSELPDRGRDPLGWGDSLRVVIRAIQESPAPVIAHIEGSVWGGGCEVALACDILVATSDASFAITPAKLGVPYNLGGVLTLMNMVPHPVLREMLFTARPIPARQAFNLGMINAICEASEIDARVADMAQAIAANSPLSIAAMKEEIRLLAGAHSVSPELFERVQALRRTVYDSHDYQEGLDAFREKRKPVFCGH